MDTITVIGDVTRTLQDLLERSRQGKPEYRVSLESPAEVKTSRSMMAQVNLFLFHIKPNPVGNAQRRVVGPDRVRDTSLALYLYYALTTFAENKLDEHRVLGSAMAVFHRHRIIDTHLLHGSLAFGADELKLDLCTFSLEDQARIWNLMNTEYRLTVFYRVRVVVLDPEIEYAVTRSETVENRLEPL